MRNTNRKLCILIAAFVGENTKLPFMYAHLYTQENVLKSFITKIHGFKKTTIHSWTTSMQETNYFAWNRYKEQDTQITELFYQDSESKN